MTIPEYNHPEENSALLVLADGTVFPGQALGATGEVLGEAVFNTAMTGYQETLTDPSYHRQLVCFSAPQIGNTGWNKQDSESQGDRIWVAGIIIRDLSAQVSNWRASHSLEEELKTQQIVGIRGVDTRSLVRRLRSAGSISAGIFSGPLAKAPIAELVAKVKNQPSMSGANLTADVTTAKAYEVAPLSGPAIATVVALDMGIKSTTPYRFAQRGIRTIVVPADSSFAEIAAYNPDGVFVSNGPGDPATADSTVKLIQEVLNSDIPFFGICFGNQLLGRALGMKTYKLLYGHRGINVPVRNLDTGKIDITSQNHGFALQSPTQTPGESFETPYGLARITHICLNDGVVEGIALNSGRAFSVQYHPEAAAGPHDADPLFDQFIALMTSSTAAKTAVQQ
ncbi:glutamine-hydrolyzing carbamoyl-phosphate synthase small subunit [Corynebacterium caspium]|uniref:glutamine-hydrolyzing carbamoyl-phosphate synthase small subunit n=1 Tax=Corynebacterium caspium TaxID=234828 RepID=UPI000372A1FF|nr:glutamine-hydrolyzing carbamoyl-phosphate synthase small subunit [Corynebacterium caspium]WKD59214.1 Carbamoyl-phosphate synthase small chain [Corynebacterium caspium DSM 44850]